MFYARVPGDFRPYVSPRLFHLDNAGHNQKAPQPTEYRCPVCREPLAAPGTVVLVPIGIAPQCRKDTGRVDASCVAVHLACSGYSESDIDRLAAEQL